MDQEWNMFQKDRGTEHMKHVPSQNVPILIVNGVKYELIAKDSDNCYSKSENLQEIEKALLERTFTSRCHVEKRAPENETT